MPCCSNCHNPLPRQGRTTCLGCGRTFHWRSNTDTLIPMRGPDQDATLLAAQRPRWRVHGHLDATGLRLARPGAQHDQRCLRHGDHLLVRAFTTRSQLAQAAIECRIAGRRSRHRPILLAFLVAAASPGLADGRGGRLAMGLGNCRRVHPASAGLRRLCPGSACWQARRSEAKRGTDGTRADRFRSRRACIATASHN